MGPEGVPPWVQKGTSVGQKGTSVGQKGYLRGWEEGPPGWEEGSPGWVKRDLLGGEEEPPWV